MGESVFLIVPVFPEDVSLLDRINSFNAWYLARSEQIIDKYQLDRIHGITLAPGSSFHMKGGATISYSLQGTRSQRVPKGLAVRLALAAIRDLIDGGGSSVERREASYVVQVDGSGAFDFSNVERILDKLIFGGVEIVLGKRSGIAWFMGHPDRKKVELFENYLLDRWYLEERGKAIVPGLMDGQAGCWGFKATALRHFGLSAPGYELEYDILATTYMNRCDCVFSEELVEGVRIGASGHSTSSGSVNHTTALQKLPFISHKLGWDREKMQRLFRDYVQLYRDDPNRALPKEYIELVERKYFHINDGV